MTSPLTDLKSLIEFASVQAEKIFRKTGEVLPMYHAIKANGETLIMPAPADDKNLSIALTKAAFALEDVDRYVFFNEAWMLDDRKGRLSPAEIKKAIRTGIVSDHPDRREIVMFMAENRRGELWTAHRFILRPERGKPSLAPLKITDRTEIGESEGRMVGLLNRG